jgi:hypothetical protein
MSGTQVQDSAVDPQLFLQQAHTIALTPTTESGDTLCVSLRHIQQWLVVWKLDGLGDATFTHSQASGHFWKDCLTPPFQPTVTS